MERITLRKFFFHTFISNILHFEFVILFPNLKEKKGNLADSVINLFFSKTFGVDRFQFLSYRITHNIKYMTRALRNKTDLDCVDTA